MTLGLTFHHDTLILDASCIISLYASRQIENILRSIPKSVSVSAYVYEKEALWIYGGPDDNIMLTKERIDLQPFVDTDLLKIVEIGTGNEGELRVNFEASLDPGEAVTGAIAVHRTWAIAIDEKKARNLFNREAPNIQLVYTLELVKHWVDVSGPSAETISAALRDIRYRAIYQPGQNHPLYTWWMKYWTG